MQAQGVDPAELAELLEQPDADALDLLCAIAFDRPIRSRRERAAQVRQQQAFFERYQTEARAVLDDLLEKYAAHGVDEFTLPDVLKVPPISERGTPAEIVALFGGAEQLREAVDELQRLLYAA